MKSIGTSGVELLIYEVLIEPGREMRVPRSSIQSFSGALYRASVELYAELQ